MRNKKSLIAILGSTIFTFMAATSISIAWFSSVAKMSSNISPIGGVVQDTYYESGDGLPYEVDPETGQVIHSPYLITRPRHLYNLAWLQNLGFYNKHDGSDDDHQFYFRLGDNIDMSQFGPIPPIGTEENPFVGNFDGQGFVISGLTISNDFSEYASHPSVVSDWNGPVDQPHILGLFGVVGDYTGANKPTSYSSAVNEFKNTGITGATIKTTLNDSLMGVAAGYVSGNMSNVLVDVSTIDISTGIAGATSSYGNFTDNISDYTLVGYTKNVANVKKTTQSIYDVEVTSNLNFNAVDEGDNEGWGGSINMKTIYYRLASLRKTKSTNVAGTFAWRTADNHYNGVVEPLEQSEFTNLSTTNNNADGMSRYVGANETGHEYIGNYNIYARSIANGYGSGSADQQFLYLSGGHYENHNYYNSSNRTGYYITDGNGNYLSVLTTTGTSGNSAGTVGNTNLAGATVWSVPTSGSGYIYTTFHHNKSNTATTYYLYVTNNSVLNLSASTQNRTTFTVATGANGKLRYTSGNYYLSIENGTWSMAALPNTPNPTTYASYFADSYQISYAGHYLGRTSNNNSTDALTQITATYTPGWKFEDTSNNSVVTLANAVGKTVRIFTSYNDNTYYMYDSAGSSPWEMNLTNRRNTGTTFNVSDNGDGTYKVTTGSYTLVYDGGNDVFSARTEGASGTYSSLTFEATQSALQTAISAEANSYNIVNGGQVTAGNGYDYVSNSASTTENSHMYYTAQDTTYFPLNVEKDVESYIDNTSTINGRISDGDLDPRDGNTGYIISGSTIASNATTLTSATSNIRISEYTIADVSNSFNKSAGSVSTIADLPDNNIYTINLSGNTVTMNTVDLNAETTNYPRYEDSKTSFYQKSLTTANNNSQFITNSYVYGLHFMSSTISKDRIVNGSKVSILGNKSDAYQLPVDCIDFNLKQKGIINFFAGTYFDDNDSFFSLYQIVRNNDAVLKNGSTNDYTSYKTISDIKEIVAVYSNDTGSRTTKYSNIYKYKKIVNGNPVYTYSEPYRFDGNQNKYKMNMNSTDESTTPYVANYEMSQSDFNAYASTYGYTQRFDSPTQIGKQASAYTDNRIYYFEIPMNDGEYCLGSVDGGTGAYLLYLDIGANAAKTYRTIFYEHFTIDEHSYSYPLGVSLNDLGDPSNYETRTAVIDISIVVDASDSTCMRIGEEAKGEFTIDRNLNNVALTRAQTNKAPPVYSSDTITRVYETSTSADVAIEDVDPHTYNVKRMEYYDYNVTLESLTVTTFVDRADENDDYTRVYVSQTIYSGNTTASTALATYRYAPEIDPELDQRRNMKIYSTANGTKYEVADIIDVDVIEIDDSKMNDEDMLLTFKVVVDNASTYEDVTHLATHVDTNNNTGTYYAYDNYVISFVPLTGSTVTIKIVSLANGATIYYEDTLITGAGQTITES